MVSTEELLKQRGSVYGDPEPNLAMQHALKEVIALNTPAVHIFHPNSWDSLVGAHNEAIGMCFCKIARIFSGEKIHLDNYDDLIGYATIAKRMAMRQILKLEALRINSRSEIDKSDLFSNIDLLTSFEQEAKSEYGKEAIRARDSESNLLKAIDERNARFGDKRFKGDFGGDGEMPMDVADEALWSIRNGWEEDAKAVGKEDDVWTHEEDENWEDKIINTYGMYENDDVINLGEVS